MKLTKDESEVFFETVDSELRCIINEYDNDTGRRPSMKRMKNRRDLENMLMKWEDTQKKPTGSSMVNLDNISECEIDLTSKELKCFKSLLEKGISDCRKELKDEDLGPLKDLCFGYLYELNKFVTVAEGILKKQEEKNE